MKQLLRGGRWRISPKVNGGGWSKPVNFSGGLDWLRESGVEVIDLESEECTRLLGDWIAAHPELWNEDIGED